MSKVVADSASSDINMDNFFLSLSFFDPCLIEPIMGKDAYPPARARVGLANTYKIILRTRLEFQGRVQPIRAQQTHFERTDLFDEFTA